MSMIEAMNRRALLTAAIVGGAFLAGCSGGTIDPAKVEEALKTGCGIAVPLADIAAVINAAVGATVQMIVDLICSGYKSSQAAQSGALKAGESATFIVHVNGHDVTVHAQPVK